MDINTSKTRTSPRLHEANNQCDIERTKRREIRENRYVQHYLSPSKCEESSEVSANVTEDLGINSNLAEDLQDSRENQDQLSPSENSTEAIVVKKRKLMAQGHFQTKYKKKFEDTNLECLEDVIVNSIEEPIDSLDEPYDNLEEICAHSEQNNCRGENDNFEDIFTHSKHDNWLGDDDDNFEDICAHSEQEKCRGDDDNFENICDNTEPDNCHGDDNFEDVCGHSELDNCFSEDDEFEDICGHSEQSLPQKQTRQKRRPRRNFRKSDQGKSTKNLKSGPVASNRNRNLGNTSNLIQINEPNIEDMTPEPSNHDQDVDIEDLILEIENKLVTKALKEKINQNLSTDQIGADKFHENKSIIIDHFIEAGYGSKICRICNEESIINCTTCGFLCLQHDISNHLENPFHVRYHNLSKLPPGLTKSGQNLLRYPVLMPRQSPLNCQCGGDKFSSEVLHQKAKILDLHCGVFEVSQKGFVCEKCRSDQPLQLNEYFENKLYPLNGNVNSSIFFTFETFNYWKLNKNENPGIGEGTFLKVITLNSEYHVKPQDFSQAYSEYNSILYHIDENIKCEQNYDCPAKLSEFKRVHSDGITKLRRFDASFQIKGKEKSFYENDNHESPFIINDELVKKEIEVYKKYKFVSKNSLYFCGTSLYKAGANSEEKQNKYDEKGMQICSCSHYFYLSACNQPHGEIFALNNILLIHLKLRGYNIKECDIDVACKFSRWHADVKENSNLLDELSLDTHVKPDPIFCVGDFHIKSHVWPCKVKYGHSYTGIGRAAAGEEQEVLNYKLARLSLNTRFMKSKRRKDAIIEFFFYENKKRNAAIVSQTIGKAETYKKDISECEVNLTKLESKLQYSFDENSVRVLREAAKKSGEDNLSNLERAVEGSVLAVNQKKIQLKSTYDPSLKKNIRNNLSSAIKDLKVAVNDYNRQHENKITEESVLDGLFPWNVRHLPNQCMKDPENYIKGCEIFLKLQRTKEELEIISHDLYCIVWKRCLDLEDVQNKLEFSQRWDSEVNILKERQEELIKQLNYEILQIRSSRFSGILARLPESVTNKVTPENIGIREEEENDFFDDCFEIYNNVEDI